MVRYWTSDWHIDHDNIIAFANRPFWTQVPVISAFGEGLTDAPDPASMNKALIDNTNDLVGVEDEIWFVGDVAMSSRKVSVPKFKALNCRNLYLVPGNHDHVHKMYPKWAKHVPLYEDAGFRIMDSQETVTIAGQEVLVCHFPYVGDSQFEDRYSGNRPTDEGKWLIHGHTHSSEVLTPDLHPRQLHVGVDAWDMRPVPETVIEEIIAGG